MGSSVSILTCHPKRDPFSCSVYYPLPHLSWAPEKAPVISICLWTPTTDSKLFPAHYLLVCQYLLIISRDINQHFHWNCNLLIESGTLSKGSLSQTHLIFSLHPEWFVTPWTDTSVDLPPAPQTFRTCFSSCRKPCSPPHQHNSSLGELKSTLRRWTPSCRCCAEHP